MNFESWIQTVPAEITGDSLWKMEAYRLALFGVELAWHDVTKLSTDRRTRDICGQLYRAAGSISANISEGYSRGSGKDRARFYEYALGSAREARTWYYQARHVLGESVVTHRIDLLTQVLRLLLTMVPDQRSTPAFHEDPLPYQTSLEETDVTKPPHCPPNPVLLTNVPMP